MRKIAVFNNESVDGYFSGPEGDLTWAYQGSDDAEFNAFIANNASRGNGGALLFGRVTFEMMASYWPTPMAQEQNPVVAKGMNSMTKYVVSHTLEKATWENSKILKGDLVTEVRKLKQESGPDIAILGSGSIVAPLVQAGLIDEIQIVLNPVVLGKGRTMFTGLDESLVLKLIEAKTFRNGKVFLRYQPATA
ncbi:dihydrofolate reductase family protein [Bdellovibrio sp. HCB337]|uniref:dihydrofolate reductase family protein n=1 Tax=Bdellovibrio sp. HCB337 TaxID=3394358 RepID=UPI0039A433FD